MHCLDAYALRRDCNDGLFVFRHALAPLWETREHADLDDQGKDAVAVRLRRKEGSALCSGMK